MIISQLYLVLCRMAQSQHSLLSPFYTDLSLAVLSKVLFSNEVHMCIGLTVSLGYTRFYALIIQ